LPRATQDRRAFAFLQLALQGEADIAAGRAVSPVEHRQRLAALLEARDGNTVLPDRAGRKRS